MDFLEKIRKLPLAKRKIILWTIVAIIGIGLISLWLFNLSQKLNNFRATETMPIEEMKKVFEDIGDTEASPKGELELNEDQELNN